ARAFEHRDTVMIGRTHGVHAEPTTFGLKLALWAFELDRGRARLRRGREAISVGKISGVVGTYSKVDPRVEEYVCGRLGLRPAEASSQILQRDRHAEFMSALAIVASSLDKFALELRHLARTEVREVEEPFGAGQKGSSAMPQSLDAGGGLAYSQGVLLALIDRGMSREDAYRLVQRAAAKAWDEGSDFREELTESPDVQKLVTPAEFDALFDPSTHLQHLGQ